MSAGEHKEQAPLVEMHDVRVMRGGRAILDDVDLVIARGEIVTLIGPNGAGKSTLCKVLLGILQPDGGTMVRAEGLRIGYVPQLFKPEPTVPLTVARFVTLTARRSAAEVEALLSQVGIAHLKDAALSAVSGGELQRAALARALASRPDLLVLDEPAQGVDVAGQSRLYELIGAIRDETGCAVLMASHVPHVVMAESDRVICLNGHICCAGVPEAVSRDAEFKRLFGIEASPAIGLYAHHHDHVHDVSGAVCPDHEHHDHG